VVTDFAHLAESCDAGEFTADPRPGWSVSALLFGGSLGDLTALPRATEFIAAGVPFDGTSSSRPGAAEGPFAIRQASTVLSSYVDRLGEHDMCDMRTGEEFRYQRARVVDAGDLHVYQTDTLRTFRAVASEVRTMAETAATLLIMGGDHSVTFPAFAGWRAAMARTHPVERIGFIHVDQHFDFGRCSAIHGLLYHGSNARRISELQGMGPACFAFVGVGSVTRKDQLHELIASGYHIVPARELQRRGAAAALAPTIATLKQHCDVLYLSIDIDVLDASVAPGTGNVTVGGLTSGELLDVIAALRSLPLGAIDVVEVAPRYDSTGRTAQIAARLMFEFVYRHPLLEDDGVAAQSKGAPTRVGDAR
jgi:agmatinase